MTAENNQSVLADSSIFSNTGNVSVVYNFGSSQSPSSPSKPPPFVLPVRKKSEDFTGRGEELKRLEELLLAPEGKKLAGIVGLAGTGGIGKSALAFHFAEQHQADFPDGVIGLQVNGKEPAAVVREFARTAKTPIAEDDTREPAILMQEVFAGRRMLLIFDNAETREIGELHPGGKCAVIVTTRDRSLPVNIDAELVEVPPLPAPEARALLARFVNEERLNKEPEATARILEVTGNLPLAVEIAGKTLQARPRLRLENYAEDLKLDSLKLPRDSNFSVLACFMQSIRLLEAEGRKDLIECFARLAACTQSGFALATAMAAAGEADEQAALEKLDNLVLLSLLDYADGDADRFMFHPLLHEFAGELAKERGLLHEARERHAAHFFNISEKELSSGDLDDLLHAADFFQREDKFGEAKQVLDNGYSLLEKTQDNRKKVSLLTSLGGVCLRIGALEEADMAFMQGYGLAVALGDQRGQTMALYSLGGVHQRQGKFDDAVQAFHQSYDISSQLEDERIQAMLLNSLGGVYQHLGQFDKAVEAFSKSYELAVSFCNQRGQAMVLNSLGGVYQRQGKFDDAVQAFRQSYDLSILLKDDRGQAMVLNSLGDAYQLQERFAEAAEFFSSSAAIGEKLDDRRHLAMVCTAWGRALLRQHQSAQALAQLERGFSIDEQMKNGRGMEIVTPLLCQALQQSGRNKEAAAFCNRALAVAPGNAKLLALQKTLEQPQLTGTVKFISPAKDGGHSFGYITMDDGSEDVRVDSRYVDISGLSKDAPVAVEIKTNRYGGRVARSVTIIAAMAQP